MLGNNVGKKRAMGGINELSPKSDIGEADNIPLPEPTASPEVPSKAKRQNTEQLTPDVILKRAERNMDSMEPIKRQANVIRENKKELKVQRTFLMKYSILERMLRVRNETGVDYTWQVNEALNYWLSAKYPDIVAEPVYTSLE